MTARAAFAASVVAYAVAVLWGWVTFPDRVPVHWGSGGAADRVLPRERAVGELVAIGAGMALLLGGAAALTSRIPMAWVNVPHKEYWSRPENRSELHRRLATDLWLLGAATVLLLVVMVVQVGLVADDRDPRLGPLFWVAFAAYVVLVLGFAVNGALRRYRPEEGA